MIDPRTHFDQTTHVNKSDPFRNVYRSSENGEALNYGARARTTAQKYDKYRNWSGDGVQFRPQNMEDESGVSSPPLWKNSPPRVPHNGYRYLSPNSRAQAIARGQWELMEMVKDMPESCYELSLKDLVEHPRVPSQEACLLEEKYSDNEILHQRVMVNRLETNNNEKRANVMRSRSIDNRGLFLKMVFPFSFGMSKRKKKNSTSNTCARVSPKPEDLAKSSKNSDMEWWKKRSCVPSESEGGGSSRNSGSTGRSSSSGSSSSSSSHSNGRRKRSSLVCCWPFQHSKTNNSME